jgi:hypothetical protein
VVTHRPSSTVPGGRIIELVAPDRFYLARFAGWSG